MIRAALIGCPRVVTSESLVRLSQEIILPIRQDPHKPPSVRWFIVRPLFP